MRCSRTAVLVASIAAAGCSEWPRWQNTPEQQTDLVPAGTDPRSLFAVSWVPVDEVEGNDSPTETTSERGLESGVGFVVSGALDGTGWDDAREAEPIEGDGCSSVGSRSPLGTGDYLGDVDFHVIDAAEPGVLCASARLSEPGFGWDLVLFPLDDCDVPGAPMAAGDAPLGIDLGGPEDGWGTNLAPGRYAVMLAGYYPNDPEAAPLYELGLSLVGQSDDALCPLLPSEGGS